MCTDVRMLASQDLWSGRSLYQSPFDYRTYADVIGTEARQQVILKHIGGVYKALEALQLAQVVCTPNFQS